MEMGTKLPYQHIDVNILYRIIQGTGTGMGTGMSYQHIDVFKTLLYLCENALERGILGKKASNDLCRDHDNA